MILTAVLLAIMHFMLSQTRFSQYTYAIGGNPQSAIRAGINVRRHLFAIYWNARVLIMDEPTAALGVPEHRKVMELIRALKAQGVAVILISHNLDDISAVAERIAVLRRGEVLGERRVAETGGDEFARLMVGDTYSNGASGAH